MSRGSSVASVAAAVPTLPRRHNHRPRPATPTVTRRSTRKHLGTPWDLSTVRKDLHDLAGLAGAVGHFSLRCRQQACERIAAGERAEQAAPHCQDPSRSPDASTVRRWAQRRLLSLSCWLRAGITSRHFLRGPTIV